MSRLFLSVYGGEILLPFRDLHKKVKNKKVAGICHNSVTLHNFSACIAKERDCRLPVNRQRQLVHSASAAAARERVGFCPALDLTGWCQFRNESPCRFIETSRVFVGFLPTVPIVSNTGGKRNVVSYKFSNFSDKNLMILRQHNILRFYTGKLLLCP